MERCLMLTLQTFTLTNFSYVDGGPNNYVKYAQTQVDGFPAIIYFYKTNSPTDKTFNTPGNTW